MKVDKEREELEDVQCLFPHFPSPEAEILVATHAWRRPAIWVF